jgi:flagellar basal body P-ring formation protein FlgA
VRLISSMSLAALCIAAVPASSAASDDAQVRIDLRPDVAVRPQQVLLGDIANVYTTDLASIQRLVALPLGQAPRPSADATLSRETIARWVRARLGIRADQVEWRGASETRVHTLAQEAPAAAIERAGRAALQEWLGERSSRFEVEMLGTLRDITLPAGTVAFTARPLAANGEPTARMVVWLDAQVDGTFVRAIPVSFAVQAYRDAWVAPSPIAAGTTLTADMLEKREIDIRHRSAAAVTDGGAKLVPGLRTTKALRAGEPLTERNSAPAPAVARGDWVDLHLKSGGVDLEERAQVLQDGQVGQMVKVKSANGSTPVMARVLARGRVEALL